MSEIVTNDIGDLFYIAFLFSVRRCIFNFEIVFSWSIKSQIYLHACFVLLLLHVWKVRRKHQMTCSAWLSLPPFSLHTTSDACRLVSKYSDSNVDNVEDMKTEEAKMRVWKKVRFFMCINNLNVND